mmetsp:Transcript_3846/g.3594  ORF Transcript_3846/g.3594 Transcript_3846/m.3594 type:complete len:140 (+) Transcript_3846:277-696(+)
MFIISIIMTDGFTDDAFLGIKAKTLCKLGAKDVDLIQQGQIHRFVLPIILHVGFLHIVNNSVFLLVIGSIYEVLIGPLRFLAVYIVAGIGGNLLSALSNDTISAGASTSLSGLAGGLLAFLVVNWVAMESTKQIRCCLL